MLIGKLIPAGTGMKRYRSVKLNSDISIDDEILFEDDTEEEESVIQPQEEEIVEAEEVLELDDSSEEI